MLFLFKSPPVTIFQAQKYKDSVGMSRAKRKLRAQEARKVADILGDEPSILPTPTFRIRQFYHRSPKRSHSLRCFGIHEAGDLVAGHGIIGAYHRFNISESNECLRPTRGDLSSFQPACEAFDRLFYCMKYHQSYHPSFLQISRRCFLALSSPPSLLIPSSPLLLHIT